MALPQGLDWLVLLGTIGFTVALIPQLIRTLRLGRADDISIPFIFLVIAASVMTFIYWVIRGEAWYVTSGFAANAVVWGIVLWYRLFPERAPWNVPWQRILDTDLCPKPMEGETLSWTMPDQDGNSVSSDDLKGTPYVLYFYPKDDTPGCTKEACGIRDNWGAYSDAGLKVYGVSKDPADTHQKFIGKYDLPFPLLTATEEQLEEFGVWKEKSMYGRTFLGINRETFLVSGDGTVLKHYKKVKPAEHAEEILGDFSELSAA